VTNFAVFRSPRRSASIVLLVMPDYSARFSTVLRSRYFSK